MADISVGDIVARLRIDSTQFDSALRAAREQMAQLTQLLAQHRTTQVGAQESTNQLAAAYLAMAQAIAAQTQAYAQAHSAALAYRQQQDALRETLRRQREEQRATTTSTQEAGTAWQRMLQVAGGLGIVTGVTAATAALARFGASLLTVGMQFEQFRAQMTAISGSAQAGAAHFTFLTQTAQRLGYALPALAQGFIQISGATRGTVLAGQETQKIFDAVATSARAMGASQQQVERALLAIGQVMSKGTVQMEELRGQLAEAIPGAVQIAARAFGVTTERLQDMVRAGEVGAIPFVRALTRQMKFELAPAAEEAGKTTAAAFERLRNEILLAKDAVAQNLPIIKQAIEGYTALLKTFRDYREAIQLQRETEREAALREQGVRPGQLRPDQTAEFDRIRRLRGQATEQLKQYQDQLARMGTGDDPYRQRERLQQLVAQEQERLQQLIVEEQQLLKTVQQLTEQRAAQQKVTAEANRTEAARAAEESRLESIRKKLEELQRLETGLAKESAAMPGFAGRLGGTPEQAETYYSAQQSALRKTLGELGEMVRGMTGPLPPELAATITELSNRYAGLGIALDKVREAQSKAKTAATDYQGDLERAHSVLANIDALLERHRAFVARPEEDTPERAATAVRLQGAQMRAQLEAQLLAFEQSSVLQAREPGKGEQLRQALAGMTEETERLATAARDAKLEDTLVKPLRDLAAAYVQVKVVQDAETAAKLAGALAGTQFADEADRYLKIIEATAKIEAQLPRLHSEAASSANALAESQQKVAQETAILARMQEQLDVQRAGLRALPWEQRTARTAARTAAMTFTDPERRREYEALLKQQAEVERLVWVNKQLETVADGVAAAWVTAFDKIVTGTANVGTAFRAMAQDILASMRSVAQSAMSEVWRQLFGLGVKAIAGMFAPSMPTGASSMGGSGFEIVLGAQHGAGPIHRPTLALMGENPATNPEYVLNRHQMDALRGVGPSAGGQAMGSQGITIINYTNRDQAHARAAQERAAGKQVILNEILSDVSRGESSLLVRALRTVQR